MHQLQPGHRAWARVAVIATALVIAAHGLVHLMGVSLLWKLGEPGQLRYADAVPVPGTVAGYLAGGLWLVAAVLFVTAAVLLESTGQDPHTLRLGDDHQDDGDRPECPTGIRPLCLAARSASTPPRLPEGSCAHSRCAAA
jgi:hypothetical protein